MRRDGQTNFLEYTLGTIPNDPASIQSPTVTTLEGRPSFGIMKGLLAGADPQVKYVIEGSPNLETWIAGLPDLEIVINNSAEYRVKYVGNSPRYSFRLKVGPP